MSRQIAPRFIGSEIYRKSSYGRLHPLAIPRVSTCIDLCRALGWLPDAVYIDSPRATPEQLARFHHPDYIAAVQQAEKTQHCSDEIKQRYGLGVNGNPVFPEIFSRPATACGASIAAADWVLNETPVHSPAGGTHHGRSDHASGFCYFNDPVLGILSLLDQGAVSVFYLDIDAHHGDGVQDAFHDDERVFTLSIHEASRWPMNRGDPATGPGSLQDRALGHARNIPVPEGFNDSEFAFLLESAVLPLIERMDPEVIVLQCGADALYEDPLSRLGLSNLSLWNTVANLRLMTRKLLVLGGGGYNPWSVARAWSGVWATLNGFEVPDLLPEQARAILTGLTWRHSWGKNPPPSWYDTLADRPRYGAIRDEVKTAAQAVLS
ncbi:acetoin utilization protein AcuC [Fodinicurvata fenggangensis]|uniref:acetoin utilization protein AcuC n=1 Tax=Fodinicurvata fenggangensis TaxID=1121830 RepID=UPI000ABDE5AC|nr:acetoin utilization protein AcuC [Fodinicurvata fenggangensis]